MCKNKSLFLQFVCRYSLFFSPGQDQLLGRAGQENIGPRISPLHEFWIAGLDSSTWIGWYGWAKSLVSRAILVYVCDMYRHWNVHKKWKIRFVDIENHKSNCQIAYHTSAFFRVWSAEMNITCTNIDYIINSWQLKWHMSCDMWFPTMWHFDKCRLRRACTASF